MSRLEWQPIYGQCSQCQQSARLEVDLAVHPHLDGKIGVRCARCGRRGFYQFAATARAEIERQADHKVKAEAAAARPPAPPEWQQFACAMLGLLPQPKEGEEETFSPSAWTLNRWAYLKQAGRGPLDRSAQEEHGSDTDEPRGTDAGDGWDPRRAGGPGRPGCGED